VFLWSRIRSRKIEVDKKLDEANDSLSKAQNAREQQERKLEQEKEAVIKRLDRIDNDHIAETIMTNLARNRRRGRAIRHQNIARDW